MITRAELEAQAEQLEAKLLKLAADLNATRGARQLVAGMIALCDARAQLKCPVCQKPNPVTTAEFADNPHIETVWCETCKAPSSREAWLGLLPTEYAPPADEEPPAGATVTLPNVPKTPVTSGRAKR